METGVVRGTRHNSFIMDVTEKPATWHGQPQ